MGEVFGYARVSTADQDASLQRDALSRHGCSEIFTDVGSGSRAHRPELDRLWGKLRSGDTVVVWRLDRLGRSVPHLIDQLEDLQTRGVGFVSLQETIDTTTPGGRLVFHVFSALAQFERDLVIERTTAGLAAARARGRVGGRPNKLTAQQTATARSLYEAKTMTVTDIGRVLGVSRSTIYRALDSSNVAK
ncbi:DNA invertase [Corynebacterium variabile DSM 44702]|uniref:Site-specific recombinases, DNA invertase Pin homologs n=3 Tax=Corynebacterium variabile TaxID=1727 RepID=A0A120N523_9CORY|nr:recombinase family protein [Corynebacterium variabile]AEK36327.1 DNA invertase [Corynebacterium variabile DSM 44702]CUU67637.1 Site-specific recombinases, DNA invertase Pin homologs [Corynebacterium variabile]